MNSSSVIDSKSNTPVTVAKFGGTSMGSCEAMLNAAKIVHTNPKTRVVVVSAMSGTTNQLLKVVDHMRHARTHEAATELENLSNRHLELAIELRCDERTTKNLRDTLSELHENLQSFRSEFAEPGSLDRSIDGILSFGERLSSLLFVQALRAQKNVDSTLMDARLFLKTDSHFGRAEANPIETGVACAEWRKRLLETREVFVTQGFIGSDRQNETTTLGRGGSDYSAALFAEALGATELEIWTDVPGILTMDPRVISTARIIPEISFAEAAEMANFGAKVLHPATLWPAVRAAIPVFVGSTFHPENGGTRILPERSRGAPLIRAIAVRNQQTLITVSSLRMLNAHGFLAKMFEVLARHDLSIDLVTTSEVSVALTVDEASLGSSGKRVREKFAMLDELRTFADVKLEEGLSLIAIIGNSLNQSSGVAAKVFQSISEFNVRLVCHGASEHNVCFLVSSSEAKEVAKRLHHVCIEWSSQ